MIVENIHEIISFRQSKWLGKRRNFITQKRNEVKNEFQKDFYKLLNNAFYETPMEHIRNRIKIENIKKDDNEKIIKKQSKLIFSGILKSYTKYDIYISEQNEILIDKLIYLGCSCRIE